MPLLNPFLRAFFRSHFVSQCLPVHDHILLVPITHVLLTTRDRESGVPYSELVTSDEFLGSHVLRIPSSESGNDANNPLGGRENRAKARQFNTINGRTIVIKDSWIYSNKGFRSLSQAQLLNDICYYPDVLEPQQWLVYYISRPLLGSMEPIPIPIAQLPDQVSRTENVPQKPTNKTSTSSPSPLTTAARKQSIQSLSELLLLFPVIARQMQPGFKYIFEKFSISFEKPLPPSPPLSAVPSMSSAASSTGADNGETNGVSFAPSSSTSNECRIVRSGENEATIREALEIAVASGIELFQKIDQSQLTLLASSTDLTGPMVEKLIERYVAEQLHDTMLFPRVCATKRVEDEELEKRIKSMENVDLTQVGIPLLDLKVKLGLTRKVTKGIEVFQKIASAKSPHAMSEILLETARALAKADDTPSIPDGTEVDTEKAVCWETTNTAVVTMNADMLVSLLLVVVIRSKVSHLMARLSYMKNYIFVDDVEAGETGYVLSTLEAVLFHILQDSDQLSLASSRNKELWKCVKKGNLDGLRTLLEPSETTSGAVRKNTVNERKDNFTCAEVEKDIHNPELSSGEMCGQVDNGEAKDISPRREADSVQQENNEHELAGDVVSHRNEHLHEMGILTKNDTVLSLELPETLSRSYESSPEEVEDLTGIARLLFLYPSGIDDATTVKPDNAEEKGFDTLTKVPSLSLPNGMESAAEADSLLYGEENRGLIRLPKSTSALSLATTFLESNSIGKLSRTFSTTSQTKDLNSIEKLTKTRNANGDSILMMAIQEKQPHILRYLLDSTYFSTKFILDDYNNDGTTLLMAAVQHQDVGVMEVLLDLLLKIPVRDLREYLQRTDSAGRTVAHYLFNYPNMIEKLGRYLPWRKRDKNGQTPLFALCRSYDHAQYRDMVAAAIKAAQDAQGDGQPLHLDDHVDFKGNTLLHIAGDQAILKLLLRCDVEVNSVNDKGFTPLMLASKYGRVDSVRILFGDQRVDVLAKEMRGLTAVELAKDDDVRNRIDDLVLFQSPPLDDGRITAVVRAFFVEDGTIRFVVKSAAPSGQTTLTITTCRRSLPDFEFLAHWLSFEHPASWIPLLQNNRNPFQIPSKPSRAVLREIQLQVDFFLRTLLAHPTFSTHELLWEFFLVPEIQTHQMIERSKKKAENRAEKIREEYTPVEDTKEVEVFVSHAKDTVRSMTYAFRSVIRRASVVKINTIDLADAYKLAFTSFSNRISFLPVSYAETLAKFAEALTPSESHPQTIFINDLRNVQSSLIGVMTALERPRVIIGEMASLQKNVDRHLASLRRSDRWPLGLLDDTRQKYHEEAAENVSRAREEYLGKASELRYTHAVAAAELSAYHGMHEGMVKRALRSLASRSLIVERARLDSMRRAMRKLGLGLGEKRGVGGLGRVRRGNESERVVGAMEERDVGKGKGKVV